MSGILQEVAHEVAAAEGLPSLRRVYSALVTTVEDLTNQVMKGLESLNERDCGRY